MVPYDFYQNNYLGSSITEQEWPALSARAQEQLNRYKRIYTVIAPEENAEAMAVRSHCIYFCCTERRWGGDICVYWVCVR